MDISLQADINITIFNFQYEVITSSPETQTVFNIILRSTTVYCGEKQTNTEIIITLLNLTMHIHFKYKQKQIFKNVNLKTY